MRLTSGNIAKHLTFCSTGLKCKNIDNMYKIHFTGFGSAKVMMELTTNMDFYGVGDSAKLHCFITSDNEIMPNCKLDWDIYQNDRMIDPKQYEKYQGRVLIGPKNSTHSFMTLKDLKADDTEELTCSAICVINGKIQTADTKTSKLKIYGRI